jgi:pimeloyl-ACP methyl ester carboxylesterase
MNLDWSHNRPNDNSDTLVLLAHGMNCSANTLSALADQIQQELPTAELHIPTIPLIWYKLLDLREAGREMAEYLAAILGKRSFKSVIVMGHSAGGVLVQSVYLDLQTMISLPESTKLRLVLIAPLTRGWTISHHLPPLQKIGWLLGMKCAWFIQAWEALWSFIERRKRRPLWILELERGAPFIVSLRLRWLASPPRRPVIYILLGSIDEIVSWRDMVDEVIDDGRVQYREVPYSNHAEIVDVGYSDNDEKSVRLIREERARLIRRALTEDPMDVPADLNIVPSFFPRMAQLFPPLRLLVGVNLGGAGVEPFPESPAVKSNNYLMGGHGAAIEEWNWDNLAGFAACAEPKRPSQDPDVDPHYTVGSSWWCDPKAARFVSPLVLLLIFGLIAALGRMAWINPLQFWVIPFLFFLLCACGISWYASGAEGGTFRERKTILVRAGQMLLATTLIVLCWYVVPWLPVIACYAWWALSLFQSWPFDGWWLMQRWQAFLYPSLSSVGPEMLGALRMFSLLGFLIGVWKVLTKV